MGAAIIAAAAAIGGSVTTGLVQYFTSARERRRQELVAACITLIRALIGHRREQYKKIDARRDTRRSRFGRLVARPRGADTAEARDVRWAAHSEVTVAIAAVQMATRNRRLRRLASEAVDSTFALGEASEGELPAARERSLAAHEALLNAAVKAVS